MSFTGEEAFDDDNSGTIEYQQPETEVRCSCEEWFRQCWQTSTLLEKLQKSLTYLLTNVGLILLVTCYCLIGGAIFKDLERHNEIQVKRSIKTIRDSIQEDLWKATHDPYVLVENEWKGNVTDIMKEFERLLIKAMRIQGWNGSENEEKLQWTFVGSLFYSIVCITTIGYGDQTPKTQLGKIVTVIYSLIGIPLMVLCLSHTGSAMARCFRFIYWRLCCFVCISNAASLNHNQAGSGSYVIPRASHTLIQKHPVTTIVQHPSIQTLSHLSTTAPNKSLRAYRLNVDSMSGPGTPKMLVKQPHLSRTMASHRRALSVRSKSSDGAKRKRRMNRAKSVELESQVGKLGDNDYSFMVSAPKKEYNEDNVSLESKDECTFSRHNETQRSRRSNKSEKSVKAMSLHLPLEANKASSGDSSQSTPTKQLQIARVLNADQESIFTSMDQREIDFEEYIRKKPIPLKICGILVVGYVLIGAYIFQKSEGWRYLNAVYFCVITLTTIGFGDFVPKTSSNDSEFTPEVSITLSSVYLLFGMSLIFMTFNLVQEQVISSLKRVAVILGLIKDEL